ncbi:hypothetical protein H6A66_10145 [Bacteroides caecigallinarum]|uniref:clostripain-related cysteine peptidase n=1 Tax=Bacteroides caecigallinarum TaxID=1411144 RepID=UPI001956D779|nr:clostripain-related cysteine peptidase [Bacteroides caecigallinarum]MBM6865522.1 hypothetical protein [Bacteroides caecigallinarum]
MKKILLLFLSVLTFISCSDEIPEEKVSLKSGRTVLAYLISNNSPNGNLDSNLKQNLVDMYSGLAQTTDSCTLIVYYRPYDNDNSGLTGPSILQFNSDGKGNINNKECLQGSDLTPAKVIGEAFCSPYTDKNHNATDPATMVRILEDMVKLSPSTSYGLIFGSHGTSWMPGKEVTGRSFGDDAGYNINIPEMAEALESVFSSRQLDFILFDACMMATAEVCYEFKDVTDYLVGAVVETHIYGYPYDVILPKLYKSDVPYADLCKDYIDFSRNKGAWGTCAAIDCRKMNELAEWIGSNLEAYSDNLESVNIDNIQQYGARTTYKYFSFDIVDLFRVLNNGTVPDGLEGVVNKVVIAKDGLFGKGYEVVTTLELDKDRYCGLGMYIPYKVKKDNWNTYYETLSWYNAVGWRQYETSLTDN